MIKARELRIGNLLQIDGNIVRSVMKIGTVKIGVSLQGGSYPFLVKTEDVAGIPLTEEWLVKLGFTKHVRRFATEYEHDCLAHNIVQLKGNFGLACVTPGIKWIHQLQNLFYCLVGEELLLQ